MKRNLEAVEIKFLRRQLRVPRLQEGPNKQFWRWYASPRADDPHTKKANWAPWPNAKTDHPRKISLDESGRGYYSQRKTMFEVPG